MKKAKACIEIGSDGTFDVYMADLTLPFGPLGQGDTVQEAKRDFYNVVDAYRDEYQEETDGLEFDFHYDIPSFLRYYARHFTLPELARATGIAKSRLAQYVNGDSVPTAKTFDRIRLGVRRLAQEVVESTM